MGKGDYENQSSFRETSAEDSPVESQVNDPSQSSESGTGVQPLSLSNSVMGALKRLQTDDPVPASAIAQQLLNMHGKEYAGARAIDMQLKPTIATKMPQSWIDEIQTLFDSNLIRDLSNEEPFLDGRLVIIGLCLLEPRLRDQLETVGAFSELAKESYQPLDKILTEQGRKLYLLDDSAAAREAVPNWLDDPLKKGEDDLLGRTAFARFLTRRIMAVPFGSCAYAIHVYGPWGSGKSTLLNFLRTELTAEHLHLFDIRPELEKDLHSQQPSSSLHELFERNNEIISEDARLQQQKNNETWFLSDKSGSYLIRKVSADSGHSIEVYTQKQRWHIVEFNAWRHQHIRPTWWSLMEQIYKDSKQCLNPLERAQERLWHFTAGRMHILLGVGIVVALAWLFAVIVGQVRVSTPESQDILGISSDNADAISKILALVATVWGAIVTFNRSLLGSAESAKCYAELTRDPMGTIKARFETLIRRIHPYRVAIFIDDLDRCQSDYVVELLEGIQTLFREVPVVFLVAADRRWLNACYEVTYDKLEPRIHEPAKPLGTLFLEKAFQFSTPMPGVSKDLKEQYWQYLLNGKSETSHVDFEKALQGAEQEVRDKTPDELRKLIEDSTDLPFIEKRARREAVAVRLAAPDISERFEHMLKPYAELLEPNPRSMKRLVNAYSANRALATLSEVDVEHHQLVLWTILSAHWPEVAFYLEKKPEMTEKLVQQNLADVPEEWKPLFSDSDVIKVARGGSSQESLNISTVQQCAQMRA